MSSISTTPTTHDAHAHDDAHGNGHDPHLAHHFDTPEQQIASGKLGMWVFLATEILMFGGLFCAYAVYRHNHPEVFEAAHKQLDKTWGAINTVVLISSSLTMAWGVRLAQLGKNKGLIIALILTLLGGFGFMAIKSVEYKTKWDHGLGVGKVNVFRPDPTGAKGIKDDELIPGAGRPSTGEHEEHAAGDAHAATPPATSGPTTGAASKPAAKADDHHDGAAAADAHKTDDAHKTADAGTHGKPEGAHPGEGAPAAVAVKPAMNPDYFDPNKGTGDEAKVLPVVIGPPGMAAKVTEAVHGAHDAHQLQAEYLGLTNLDKSRTYTFFQVYFLMTGLHGIHVIVGMALIFWILVRATPPGSRRTVKWAGLASVGLFLIYVGLLVGGHGGTGTFWTGMVVTVVAAAGWFMGALNPPMPRLGVVAAGEFGPDYFAPVDIVGLYWHLVDLIWIFLFPLLYLIH